MEIARSVGADWTNWTRDTAALEAAREKLGQTIDQIMSKNPPNTGFVRQRRTAALKALMNLARIDWQAMSDNTSPALKRRRSGR